MHTVRRKTRPETPRVVRGQGALGNPAGRFEQLERDIFDDGWAGPAADESQAPQATQTVVTNEVARSIISRNQSPDIAFDQSVNPYRGCEHGCVYCYARPSHSYLGLSPGIDFERRLVAKVNAAQCLAQELSAPGYRCSPIAIGTVTDAYQPIERERGLTRAILEVLGACGHPFTLTTKSALVERDIDLLAQAARRGLAAVHITITTLDPVLARAWEPRAAAPWRRLETVRRLAEAGVPTAVSVAPVVPFLNEPELERILEQARQAGARRAWYMMLRLPHELLDVFTQWLNAHYPDRAQRVLNRLRDLREEGAPAGRGRLNDPRFHSRMKGRGHWAELVRLRHEVAARRLGYEPGEWALRCDLFVPPRPDGQLGLFQDLQAELPAGK